MDPTLLLIAVGLDLLLGDPRFLHHPVVYIGRLINFLETGLRGLLNNRCLAGMLLCLAVLFVVGGVTALFLWLSGEIHPLLQSAVAVYIAFTTLALRQLHKESHEVVAFVETGDLGNARRSLSLIVGRETAHLNEDEILRACIEKVAENTSSGVVAPMFYLLLGGPVLAMIYKATSTLDSIVGYRDDQSHEMGRASSRLDDLLNLLPARLTGVLMIFVSLPLGLNSWSALKVMLRDARKPSSPNSGYPEAAVAGALGIQLGGPAVYFGVQIDKPTLGDPDRPITIARYRSVVQLMYGSSFLALLIGFLLIK